MTLEDEAQEESEDTSEHGLRGGEAKPGGVLDSAIGQIIAAAIVLADAIATVLSFGKALFAVGKAAIKAGIKKFGKKIGGFFKDLFGKKKGEVLHRSPLGRTWLRFLGKRERSSLKK